MELAEALMFVGVIGWHFVGKSEEEESEGFARNEVETGFLDSMGTWFGRTCVTRGLRESLHLLKLMYDGRMELVLVGQMVFKVAANGERFRAEGTLMLSWELAEEAVEVELTECRGGVLAASAMEKGEVARVHSGVLGRGERRDLSIQSLACRGIGGMLVDEVRFETIPVRK